MDEARDIISRPVIDISKRWMATFGKIWFSKVFYTMRPRGFRLS